MYKLLHWERVFLKPLLLKGHFQYFKDFEKSIKITVKKRNYFKNGQQIIMSFTKICRYSSFMKAKSICLDTYTHEIVQSCFVRNHPHIKIEITRKLTKNEISLSTYVIFETQ